VPALSAIPVDLGDSPGEWRVVAARHGPMGSIADPVEVLRSYAGDRIPPRGGPVPERPWLGLDLDDFAAAGQPIPIGVALLPAPLRAGSARVAVTALDGGPRRRCELPVDPAGPAGAAWRGELDPLPAGCYEVAVSVAGVAGWGTVAAAETLVVLDAATGGEEP
jgi:hypothetical protein